MEYNERKKWEKTNKNQSIKLTIYMRKELKLKIKLKLQTL